VVDARMVTGTTEHRAAWRVRDLDDPSRSSDFAWANLAAEDTVPGRPYAVRSHAVASVPVETGQQFPRLGLLFRIPLFHNLVENRLRRRAVIHFHVGTTKVQLGSNLVP
jgi:hypothetical protein